MSKQIESSSDDVPKLLQLVVNGGIRWNSTHDMLERAYKLKDAIDLYAVHFRNDQMEPTEDDTLTSDDWNELTLLMKLLAPMKEMSLLVQSDYGTCQHGTLFESLQSIDWLMTKLEATKADLRLAPNSHFKASINLGWKKLNKYYTLSDETFAYRAAILLHPLYKKAWFTQHWGAKPQWIQNAVDALQTEFELYSRRWSDKIPEASRRKGLDTSEMTEFQLYNFMTDDVASTDELDRWYHEPRDDYWKVDPLEWWNSNSHRYPILSRIAFDLLAAPASSSADERTFSKAGHVVNNERWQTSDELAEAYQCLKSWYDGDIVINNTTSKPN